MKNQFAMTREMFANATTAYKFPMSYEDWMNVPEDYKCAALFVNFYDQIVLAWQKQKTYFLEDEDAVSIVIQYLLKNVDKIKADRKRYTAAYVFTVACNAIIGFTRPAPRRDYYDNYQSQYFTDNEGNEKDIFEILEDDVDRFDAEKFGAIVESLDSADFELFMYLIHNKLSGRKTKQYADALKRLREVFAECREMTAA